MEKVKKLNIWDLKTKWRTRYKNKEIKESRRKAVIEMREE